MRDVCKVGGFRLRKTDEIDAKGRVQGGVNIRVSK